MSKLSSIFSIKVNVALALFFWGCSAGAQVKISDGVISEGQECFKIETPNATYLYQKTAGGFCNMLDRQGTDWIQFHKTDEAKYPTSAAADYRGLPNLVFGSEDGGCGHPGFQKMTSEKVFPNQIRSVSNSGKWQWIWTFHDNFAEMEIEKSDPDQAYWFLYEGPIAGQFSPDTHYWGTDVTGPLDAKPDLVIGTEMYGNWQTAYFGDADHASVFFVHQMKPDTLKDLYTYMGDDINLGNESPDGMVVFGFGRDQGAQPLMTIPQKFRIGYHQGKISNAEEHKQLINYIKNLNQ
ncbi:MAG: hypothetical protein DHS20C17_16370 [Cyclobacteriaceae bacterium]|nr:MAG: hypothetical protein DHS20C17_16370 [Cyclobacteriaceae bacterium]